MQDLGLSALLATILSFFTGGLENDTTNAYRDAEITSSDSGKVVNEYPIETAIVNIYNKASSETLYTTFDGLPVAIDFTVAPKGVMMFEGKQVQGSGTKAVTKILGQVVDKSAGINYFTLNPLKFYGFTDSSGEYSTATQSATIPKSAKIGESSLYLTENVYSDNSKSDLIERYTQTWRLSQASNDKAWLCIDSSANLLLEIDPDGSLSDCYKINARGDILENTVTSTYPEDNEIKTYTLSSK